MELIFCVVFISSLLFPINYAQELSLINSTSQTGILRNNSVFINRNTSLNHAKKECDCGVLANGCHLLNGKKICDCDFWAAQDGDECRHCNCGVLSTKCYFEKSQQICNCLPGSAQTSYGTCEWCDCGYRSKKCEFQSYKKVCTCDEGYIEKSGKCEVCDCGYGSISCYLSSLGIRKCTCKPGYYVKTYYYKDDEECIKYMSGPSSWRVATYIESTIFLVIIFGLAVFILGKKASL